MGTIMINLYDYVTPFSSLYNIQTKERDVHSPLPYLIFKTLNKFHFLPSPLFPPLTLYFLPPPNFQIHHKGSLYIKEV
jgi:hypothetical protein